MRGDRPFAYDLVMRSGAVSSRVALLLRSTEAKPGSLSSVTRVSGLLLQGDLELLRRVVVEIFFSLVLCSIG